MINSVQKITILGATGSIGTQTLEVIARHPQRFRVFALSAMFNADLLFQQCMTHRPQYAVLGDVAQYTALKARLVTAKLPTTLLCGEQALCEVAAAAEVSQVVAAVVGGAGLRATHAAVQAGKRVLLANKESLVMTGNLLLDAAQQHGASILPLDSEHNALFQCLPAAQGFREKTLAEAGVSKLLLTGSGGPFRQAPLAELAHKTPEQACKHPNWSMGRKISVDSATMMNKGLEYIEAKLLFAAAEHELDVIIHPQSIIHSLVQYKDGTSLAQIGHSDMRVPISYALGYPQRLESGVKDIDLSNFSLTFETVDYHRYPALKIAMSVADDSALSTVMNAANEVAVAAFLAQRLGFMQIIEVVDACLEKSQTTSITSVDEVVALDATTRRFAEKIIHSLRQKT